MKKQRIAAFHMTLALVFNSCAPAWAESTQSKVESATIKSVTLTADVRPGKLTALTGEHASMVDNGSTLQNIWS